MSFRWGWSLQMLPVLSREVVEGKQRVAILDQALDSLVVFDAQVSMKASNAASASFLVSAIQISWSARLAFDCWLLGSLFKTLAVLCTQQRWPRVLGHTSSTACQKPRAMLFASFRNWEIQCCFTAKSGQRRHIIGAGGLFRGWVRT